MAIGERRERIRAGVVLFHLYFETDDVKAAAEELKRKGVELERDVWETPWSTREFVIRETDGHTLYFSQPL